MRDDELRRRKMNYYAKILIAISFALLVYGIVLDINNDTRLFDPVEEAEKNSNSNVTMIDVHNPDEAKPKPGDSEKKPDQPSPSPDVGQENQSKLPTIEDNNDALRKMIQETYNVTVYYGHETDGYVVGGMSTVPIDDAYVVNKSLNDLYNCMILYPKGFWKEIHDGGIPLTIYLIDSYSYEGVTGVTDSNYSYAKISIAIRYGFAETFFHESYHYIERYIFKNNLRFTTWDSLNPADFTYNQVNPGYVYNITFSSDAYFVNTYAETDQYEDRASTFEYMMDSSKASCLNEGKPVWKKAKLISTTIETVLNTCTPETTEYWERYL